MNWIPVNKHLPGAGVRVLAWVDGRLPDFAYRDATGVWCGPQAPYGQLYPTHWCKVLPPNHQPISTQGEGHG